jgi:hypothetical protein
MQKPWLDPRVFAPAEAGGANAGAGSAVAPRAGATTAKVRLNLDVSQEIAEFLDTLAQENATTKTDVMRRAIALLKVAHDEKKRHRSMGFVSESRDDVLETKVVGVL